MAWRVGAFDSITMISMYISNGCHPLSDQYGASLNAIPLPSELGHDDKTTIQFYFQMAQRILVQYAEAEADIEDLYLYITQKKGLLKALIQRKIKEKTQPKVDKLKEIQKNLGVKLTGFRTVLPPSQLLTEASKPRPEPPVKYYCRLCSMACSTKLGLEWHLGLKHSVYPAYWVPKEVFKVKSRPKDAVQCGKAELSAIREEASPELSCLVNDVQAE